MFIIPNAFSDAVLEETCSFVLDSGVDSSFSISIRRHLIRSQLAQAPPLLLDISEVSDFDKSKKNNPCLFLHYKIPIYVI